MTQTQDQASGQIGFDRFDLATPVLILLRAELLALEQLLPGHPTANTIADNAALEALTDNFPV